MAASALLNIMVKAAHKAGRSLTRDFGEVENLQVSRKGPADFVSNADRKAEEIVRDELLKARPTYSFLMEEGGEIKGTDGQHRWIVDPLDGTTNFLHSIPLFACAIALERNGEIVASVIYNPIMEETFTAEKGRGAWLNERKRLRVAGRRHLADCVMATGIKLTGTDNDARAYERTGLRRSLNRHRFDDADALERRLQDGATRAHRILCGLRRMLEWRRRHAAFAPDAQQRVLDAPRGLVAIERRATDTAARVLVNTTPTPIDVRHLTRSWRQLTGDRPAPVLGGWQSLWLTEI